MKFFDSVGLGFERRRMLRALILLQFFLLFDCHTLADQAFPTRYLLCIVEQKAISDAHEVFFKRVKVLCI